LVPIFLEKCLRFIWFSLGQFRSIWVFDACSFPDHPPVEANRGYVHPAARWRFGNPFSHFLLKFHRIKLVAVAGGIPAYLILRAAENEAFSGQLLFASMSPSG
jgi:hypothetical protein